MHETPLEVAISQLGTRRGRSRQDDDRIHLYLGGHPLERGVYLDYCAAFVLWSHATAEERIPVNFWRARACWYLQRRLHDMGWCVDGPPEPGDIFFMSRGPRASNRNEILLRQGEAGHTGMVWEPMSNGFRSIEGNIRRRERTRIHRHAVSSRPFASPYRFIKAFYRRPRPPTPSAERARVAIDASAA